MERRRKEKSSFHRILEKQRIRETRHLRRKRLLVLGGLAMCEKVTVSRKCHVESGCT